jgi:CPA2 family monovalent cation:H+ antiporter-2
MLFTFALAQAGEFGFFLAAFAGQLRVLTREQTDLVLIVVSLSMFLTPVLFLIQDKLGRGTGAPADQPDGIDAKGPVIVAGYGRFGRTIDRMLRVAGHTTVVLDADRQVVSHMRALGVRAYYGEVERPDLLEAAGIAQADALVIAIDDRAKSLALARFVRREYPKVRIVARAHDQQHVLELEDLGVTDSVREVFDGAVRAGRQALAMLGHDDAEIEIVARALLAHDKELRTELAAIWDRRGRLESAPDYAVKVREFEERIDAEYRKESAGRNAAPAEAASPTA